MADDDARTFALVEIGDLDAAGLELLHVMYLPPSPTARKRAIDLPHKKGDEGKICP